MKYILVLVSLVSFSSYAGSYSLGGVIGTPTGLSAKYEMNDVNSLQADLSSLYSALDYTFKNDYHFNIKNASWHNGAGLIVKDGLGVRGITSLEYDIEDIPFHAFGNLSFNLHNNDGALSTFIGLAIGARYNF